MDPDFGKAGGTPIENWKEILTELDERIGTNKPPSLEYLFCMHAMNPDKTSSRWGRFGHAAIRYTLPDGTQRVMNVVGLATQDMINFLTPSQYLFGTQGWGEASEQGGIYNRSFCSVRLESLSDAQVLALDAYFNLVHCSFKAGAAGFNLTSGRLQTFLRKYWPVSIWRPALASGNCAYWTSGGLVAAGLLHRQRTFPKSVWADLLEAELIRCPRNVHVVMYREVSGAPLHTAWSGAYRTTPGLVNPLRPLWNWCYADIAQFADYVVEVPAGSMRAVISKGAGRRPHFITSPLWRNLHVVVPLLLFLLLWCWAPTYLSAQLAHILAVLLVIISYTIY